MIFSFHVWIVLILLAIAVTLLVLVYFIAGVTKMLLDGLKELVEAIDNLKRRSDINH